MITRHYKIKEKQGTALRQNIKAYTHIAITDITANWVAHIRKATVPFNLNYSTQVIFETDLTNSRVLHLTNN